MTKKIANKYRQFGKATFVLLLLVPLFHSYNRVNTVDFTDHYSGRIDSLLLVLEQNPHDFDTANKLVSNLMHAGDYSSVIEYMRPLYLYAGENGMESRQAIAAVMIGQAYGALNKSDSMYHYFAKAEELGHATNNIWVLAAVQNGLGVHTMYGNADYPKAISYFMRGLEYAEKHDNPEELSNPILSNISNTYYLKEDTLGLKYALEVYTRGKNRGNNYMVFSGALNAAQMYYLLEDYQTALTYIQEASSMTDEYHSLSGVHSLYGNILYAIGEDIEAEEHYLQAMDYIESSEITAVMSTFISYGNFLVSEGRFPEAVSIFEKGIESAREKDVYVQRYKLYHGISEAYELQGDAANALNYYKVYREEADSVYNIQRETAFNDLMIKYETEKREKELFKERKRVESMIFLSILIVFVAIAIFLLYQRKNRMYRELVKQYHEYTQKAKLLDSKYRNVSNPGSSGENSQETARDKELFSRIENVIKAGAYRDKMLTIEKLAETVGSNRTYVSRIINEYSGAAFNHYINSYRIEEAVTLLSDPDSDKTLQTISEELGFNNVSTFYRSFRNVIGVPPSKFREEYKRMFGVKQDPAL